MPRWGPRFASATDSGSAPAIESRPGSGHGVRAAPAADSTRSLAASIAAVAVTLLGCLVIARASRGLTFSGDDWGFITDRRGFSAGVFLRPHNEHLSALPIAAYKLLLAVFGASSYVPFMALLLITHGVVCLLVYAIARRYVGPWAALAPTAILAVLGPAWQDLLWAFQVGYLGSVAAGLGMVLCLEWRSRAGERGAAALLCVSLLCSSIGVAMVVLGLVLVVLQRPWTWRRLWVIAVPVVLYLIWYAVYGVSTIRAHNIVHIPHYVAQALSAGVASITGLAQTHTSPFLVSTTISRYVALVAIVLAVYYLVRGGRFPPLFWASIAAAIALWVAECLEYTLPARSAEQSRYQYTAAALLLLAVVSALAGRRLRPAGAVVLAVVVAAICAANISMLDQRSVFWTENSSYVYAETGALEVARDTVAPNFTPENGFTIPAIGNHNLIIAAGPYLSAVDAFGSAADRPGGIERRPEKIREAADQVLGGAERLGLGFAPSFDHHGPGCRSATDGAALGPLTLGPGAVRIQVHRGTPAALQLRRFASNYRWLSFGNAPPQFPIPRLVSGRPMIMHVPRDRASLPWQARVVGGRNVVVCVPAG